MYLHSVASHAGPKRHNEDRAFACTANDSGCFACVADGVGGVMHGGFAAEYVVERFREFMGGEGRDLGKAVRLINADLVHAAAERGMADEALTTFTAFFADSHGQLHGVHVGDCRALVFRGQGVRQLTQDHTEAVRLFNEGRITKEEFVDYPRKHVLESVMGLPDIERLDVYNFSLEKGDRAIIVSDGVYDVVSKRLMRDINVESPSLEAFTVRLIAEVQRAGPNDNFSIAAVERYM